MIAPDMVQPAFLWVPEHTSTAGGEAADFARAMGMEPEPEQLLALDVILAERPDGRWAAPEVGIAAPRQNLKSFCFEVVCLSDLWLGFGSELIVWTAHEFNTAMEAFRHVKQLIEEHEFLSRRVARVTEGNGTEGVELIDGKRLRFKARTKAGGRGLTGDRTVLDEAQQLQASHMGSLMPTMSAKSQHGNPQLLYGGSAGLAHSSVWRRVRDRGRAGGEPRLAWLEWCAAKGACASERCDHRVGSAGCQLDDEQALRQANPGLGRRISVEWIVENERKTMTPEEYARERFGWWDDPEEATVDGLPLDVWNACAVPESKLVEVQAWAVAPAEDLSWCAIAAVGTNADGKAHGEVVEYRRGTAWVAERMVELRTDHGEHPVVLEAKGPRSNLADDLAEVGIDATFASADEVVEACGELLSSLLDRKFVHIAQGELDMAVKGGRRRNVGEAWTWARRGSSAEISPVIAVTLALWGAGESVSLAPFLIVT